mgnify:CR=1 FL=1
MTKYIDKFEDEITSKQIEPKEEYISCKICGLNVISKRYHLGNWVYVKDEHEVDPNITLGDTLPLYDQIITAGELKDWETPEFMNQIENGDFKTESIQAEGSFGKLVLKSCLSKGKFPKLHRGKIKGKNKIIESFNPLPLKESTPDSWYKKSKPIEVLSLGGGMDSCTEVIRNGDFYDIIIMSLAGNTIASTYPLLLKIDSNGIDGTLRAIQEQLDNLIERFDLDIPRLAKRSNDTIQDYREKMKNMVQSGSQRNPEEITVWKGSEKQTGLQYVRTWYPLIENKITVDEETKILNEKGFEIPPKSGCYLCPLKSNVKFKQLEVKHPELYENAKMIDMNSKSKRKAKNWNDIESLDPNMGENPLLVKCACSDGDLSQLEDDEE